MGDYLIPFLIVLMLIAVLLQDDSVLTLLYLLLGAFVGGLWWTQRALVNVRAQRTFPHRVFWGERVPIQLEIANLGLLPVVWLQVNESLPTALVVPNFFRQVITLGPRARQRFEYQVEGRRRGYYPIGPLRLSSGDLLGAARDHQRHMAAEFVTVYPKIVSLTRVDLPSSSPLGTLRHTQPIFEDPSRILGKRDYVAGDSLRRVDWKSTASSGRLQVKLFEPSIALETAIFLNLNDLEYDRRSRLDASELAIVVAASLANWIIGQRQAAGLVTNGVDSVQASNEGLDGIDKAMPPAVPPRRGRGHLMRILDVLARIELGETVSLAQLLRQEMVHLTWGTTLILITNQVDDDVFDSLFQARRKGLDTVLVLCGTVPGLEAIRSRAAYFGFPVHHFLNERDLDVWRR